MNASSRQPFDLAVNGVIACGAYGRLIRQQIVLYRVFVLRPLSLTSSRERHKANSLSTAWQAFEAAQAVCFSACDHGLWPTYHKADATLSSRESAAFLSCAFGLTLSQVNIFKVEMTIGFAASGSRRI